MNDIATLYSKEQQGGELPYFVGRQYGSGWLRTLARLAFPILKRFGRAAVNTASDVIMKNKSILPSLKEHAIDAAGIVVPEVAGLIRDKLQPAAKRRRRKSINKHQKGRGTIFHK